MVAALFRGYLVSITLRGLPIFGSPFKVTVTGGGQYAEHSHLDALGRLPADPTSEEVEAEIAAVPSPTLHRLRSVPAEGGVALHELPLKEMQAIEPKITKDVLGVLSVESSVKSRTSFGGTAPKNVAAQAKAWAKRLEKERKSG